MLLTDLPKVASEYLPEKGMRGWQYAEHIGALLALPKGLVGSRFKRLKRPLIPC